MTIEDLGPQPQTFDLEKSTRQNTHYRTVAWSGRYLQLTLMSIPVGGDIGLEMHPETDQFIRLDGGRGRVQMGGEGPAHIRGGGLRRLVPHDTSRVLAQRHQHWRRTDAGLRYLCARSPQTRKIHKTASDAAADVDDEPADWSVQPDVTPGDEQD